jgi:hypothetical protein
MSTTRPSSAAWIGVPRAAAMSMPAWMWPGRCSPKAGDRPVHRPGHAARPWRRQVAGVLALGRDEPAGDAARRRLEVDVILQAR